MSKIAYLFPGQGSQVVGMGKDISDKNECAKNVFDKANQSLGFDLKTMCFEGPEESLKVTYNTQPALLTTSVALYEAAKTLLPKADYVAGHSLGEYSALVVSGSLTFEDAVRTVHIRGKLMNEAVPSGVGAMAAVMGGERELIKQVCNQVASTGLPVQMANINCPGQIVISGIKEGVEKASTLLKENGVKRVIELPVSGPFHSELMEPIAKDLEKVLNTIQVSDSTIPVVSNIDAMAKVDGTQIKSSLVKQVYSSVLWEDSIQYMINQGVDTLVEIGSGKVLTGLVKKIDKNVKVHNIYDSESLNTVAKELGVLV